MPGKQHYLFLIQITHVTLYKECYTFGTCCSLAFVGVANFIIRIYLNVIDGLFLLLFKSKTVANQHTVSLLFLLVVIRVSVDTTVR